MTTLAEYQIYFEEKCNASSQSSCILLDIRPSDPCELLVFIGGYDFADDVICQLDDVNQQAWYWVAGHAEGFVPIELDVEAQVRFKQVKFLVPDEAVLTQSDYYETELVLDVIHNKELTSPIDMVSCEILKIKNTRPFERVETRFIYKDSPDESNKYGELVLIINLRN